MNNLLLELQKGGFKSWLFIYVFASVVIYCNHVVLSFCFGLFVIAAFYEVTFLSANNKNYHMHWICDLILGFALAYIFYYNNFPLLAILTSFTTLSDFLFTKR